MILIHILGSPRWRFIKKNYETKNFFTHFLNILEVFNVIQWFCDPFRETVPIEIKEWTKSLTSDDGVVLAGRDSEGKVFQDFLTVDILETNLNNYGYMLFFNFSYRFLGSRVPSNRVMSSQSGNVVTCTVNFFFSKAHLFMKIWKFYKNMSCLL